MDRSTTAPDAFLAGLPDTVRPDMQRLDAAISDVMAGLSRTLWEGRFWGGSDQRIIGYGDLVQRQSRGTVEWFLVGLAAQQRYLSVYINAADEDGYLVERYADRLGRVKAGRSNVSFPSLDALELPVLLELVAEARTHL